MGTDGRKFSFPLLLHPYMGNITVTRSEETPEVDRKYHLVNEWPCHWESTFMAAGEECKLYFKINGEPSENIRSGEMFVLPANQQVNPRDIPYRIGDNVIIGDCLYSIRQVSLDHPSVLLEYAGDSQKAEGYLTGYYLPELKAVNLNGGDEFEIKSLYGKYVVIDFWGTWCSPCIAAIPAFKEVKERFGDGNIEFVSIACYDGKNQEKLKTMVEEKGMDWMQLMDGFTEINIASVLKIERFPTIIVISPEGEILNRDLDVKNLGEFLEGLPGI